MNRISAFDSRVNEACVHALRSSRFKRSADVMLGVSRTGSYGLIWILVFLGVAVHGSTLPEASIAAASVIVTLLVNTAVKMLVVRPRPPLVVGKAPHSSSFPSAHTSMAVVGAATLSAIVPQLALVAWVWAGILAASRVVLGAHYLSDVIAGAMLGSVMAFFALQTLSALT